MLIFDGVFSQIMSTLTGGAFLVAFALALGASNLTIGFIAAVGPLAQVLQIPSIFLIEKTGRRKFWVVWASVFARLSWLGIAFAPFLLPRSWCVPWLLGSLLVFYAMSNVSGCGFAPWIKDLIPEKILGTYLGKRLAIANTAALAVGLLASLYIDIMVKEQTQFGPYAWLFSVGAVFGILSSGSLALVPEPEMIVQRGEKLLVVLQRPFKNANYTKLLAFLGSWNFAVNLAIPFLTVYMLKRLNLSMTMVLVLSVFSQLANAFFTSIWGKVADRMSHKTTLMLAGHLMVISILFWPLIGWTHDRTLIFVQLAMLHLFAGMSTAGVVLCANNIALKLSPAGQATSFLGINALLSGATAAIAPILGGFLTDKILSQSLEISIFEIFHFKSLDILFFVSAILSALCLWLLRRVKEEGEVEEHDVIFALQAEVRKAIHTISNLTGMNLFDHFPFWRMRHPHVRRKEHDTGKNLMK